MGDWGDRRPSATVPCPGACPGHRGSRSRLGSGARWARAARSASQVSVAATSLAAARGAGRTLDRLLERPRTVLAALAGVQIAATLALALRVEHNGWVYFQGGDQIWFTSTGWLLGRLEVAPTESSYLWPLVQAPITWLTGPTYVQALPVLVVLNVLVLGPIALLCIYGIANRIGGRLLGYWAALLWVVAPYAAIPLFVDRYHEKWTEQFLPQATGLTAMADYPSMVIVLAAAFFVTRSLSPGRVADAALAGLLLGAAGGLKPPNLLLGFGAALAYPLARRWREAVAFAPGVALGLLMLALWKQRTRGEIPAFALEHVRLAAGATPAVIDLDVDRYINLDLDHWRLQMDQLREFFWSPRVAQWAPLAGVLAVIRVRRGAIAGLLAGWLGAFILIKGFNETADIQANTFWRLLMPAWPAYLLLFASIPLLVPTLARRLGARSSPPADGSVRARWVVVALVLTILLPAAATAASSRVAPPTPAIVPWIASGEILTPVDTSIALTTERVGNGLRLSWTGGPWRGDVFYRVYRGTLPDGDLLCSTSNETTWVCYLHGELVATTRDRTFLVADPSPGATYRVGVGTNWANDPNLGDTFAFSPPVRAPR